MANEVFGQAFTLGPWRRHIVDESPDIVSQCTLPYLGKVLSDFLTSWCGGSVRLVGNLGELIEVATNRAQFSNRAFQSHQFLSG
jgi:hypothetical protein